MRESRLFQIVYYLLDRGQATAPELAERLEVSVRTIYRDIDALSGAGIPIYAEAGRNGGIRIMHGFVLDKAVLSEAERQEILAALQGLSATQNIQSDDTLRKLGAIFHVDFAPWLEINFSRWGSVRDQEIYRTLKTAVLSCKAVTVTYASTYGEIVERKIYPLKLSYRARAWYVKAYCTKRRGFRLFRLTRIIDCAQTEETFSRCVFPEPESSQQEEYPTITLWFPKEMAYRVYDEFDCTQIQRQANGDFITVANMPVDGWLIGFLLSCGTQVEVLSPAFLREAVAQQAKLIYEKNKP